jgi:hypothetical protein
MAERGNWIGVRRWAGVEVRIVAGELTAVSLEHEQVDCGEQQHRQALLVGCVVEQRKDVVVGSDGGGESCIERCPRAAVPLEVSEPLGKHRSMVHVENLEPLPVGDRHHR